MTFKFGETTDGVEIFGVTLQCDNLTVTIITYGAAIQSIKFPDRNGAIADLVLGFDTVAEYELNSPYLGVAVGRVAGRIRDAQFNLPHSQGDNEDTVCHVTNNHAQHCLHGGHRGLSRQIWQIKNVSENSVSLSYFSPDGEEGFPGNVEVTITYSLESENSLVINYEASTDKICPINLTNHSYFNLQGEGSADIYDHTISIQGTQSPELDEHLLPTGKIIELSGQCELIEKHILSKERLESIGNNEPRGFDHFILFDESNLNKIQTEVQHEASGRVLQLFTDQVGVQFYTANFLNNEKGKNGHIYAQHSAFCLEAQGIPDSPNRPEFPSIFLAPEEKYKQTTKFVFALIS